MKKEAVIDKDFFASWKNYVFHEDEIKWAGKPHIELSFRFLEKGVYHDVMTGASSIITIYTVLLICIAYGFFESGYYYSAIIITILGLIVPFAYEYFIYKNRQKTAYAITEKYILFKFYTGLKFQIHAIPIEDMVKIHLIKESNKIGTIILVSSQKVNFSTYSGRTGLKREHPTLEFIDDCDKVAVLLKKLISNNPKKELIYQEPTITGNKLKVAKIIYAMVISLMSIYLIDFFILPSKIIDDEGNLSNRILIESNYKRFPEGMGGHYQTKLKKTFNTSDYFPELGSIDLELKISPIFKIVKGVKSVKMDYTDRLSSSLNHIITKCAYFITYLVVSIGFLIIRKKTAINSELYGKVLMSSIGFLGFLYLIWRIHN